MCNWVYQWYRPAGPLRTRSIARTFWELVMEGLAPRGSL